MSLFCPPLVWLDVGVTEQYLAVTILEVGVAEQDVGKVVLEVYVSGVYPAEFTATTLMV